MVSVNTNVGAAIALQNLSATNRELAGTQNRISTGLKVANAVDNGAIFAIAESQRTRVEALGAVKSGIDRTRSAIDFGVRAGEAVNEILGQLRLKAQEAAGPGLSEADRDKLQTDFSKLRDQIDQIVGAAEYNGVNLASNAVSVSVLTSDQGSTGSGNFVVASGLGAAFADGLAANQQLVSSAQALDAVDAAYEDGDALTFSQTVGGITNTYEVTFEADDTIDDLVTKINDATGGAITARFDDQRGELVYSSTNDFTVAYTDGGGAAAPGAGTAALAFLIGTGDGQQLSTATAGAQATVAANYGGGAAGASAITVTGGDFRSATLNVTGLSVTGADGTNATSAIATIDTALDAVRNSLSSLGSQSKALEVQSTFLTKLSDTLDASIGNLVDADLAEESALLQALQTKQQLGTQALSIANQSSQQVLSLFR